MRRARRIRSSPPESRTVPLRRVSRARAEAITAGAPLEGDRWAPGYPTDGDREAAGYLLRQLDSGNDPGAFGIYEILDPDGGETIGGIGFHRAPGRDGGVEVGYGLVPSRWNRGYATTALREVLRIAIANGATRVDGRAVPDNFASRRVLEKAGFSFVDLVDGYVRYRIEL